MLRSGTIPAKKGLLVRQIGRSIIAGFLLLQLVCGPVLFGQTESDPIAGLEPKLATAASAKDSAKILIEWLEGVPRNQRKLIHRLGRQVVALSANDRSLSLLAAQGIYWEIQGSYERDVWSQQLHLAPERLAEPLTTFRRRGATLWEMRVLALLSNISYLLGDDDEALQYYGAVQQFMDANTVTGPYTTVAGEATRTRANLYFVYDSDLDAAQEYYQRALQQYQLDTVRNHYPITVVRLNQALLACYRDKFQQADSLYALALQRCSIQDTSLRGEILLERAHNLALEGLYAEKDSSKLLLSSRYLTRAESLGAPFPTRLHHQLAGNAQNLALHFYQEGASTYDSLLALAAHHYRVALRSSIAENNQEALPEVIANIAKLHKLSRLPIDMETMQLIDTAYQQNFTARVAIEEERRALLKQANLTALEGEKQSRIRSIIVLIAALLGLAAIFLFLYQRQRFQNLRQQFESRMEALRSQMNSHFISNTLNAIDSLIMEGKRSEASSYVVEFSRLCRNILNSSKKAFIGLDEEIKILKGYLKFEKLRLGERLNIKWELEPTIDLSMHQVPALILQPFVENAIWHGILSKEDRQQGTVRIAVQHLDEANLRCMVEDDGVGRKRARALRQEQAIEWQSWGMKITNERIEALKGIKDATIEFEDLYAPSGEAAGTRVVITLPKYLNVEA